MLCLCNVPCFFPFEVVAIFVKFRVMVLMDIRGRHKSL